MKTLVIGLDGATPELLFGDERLANVRRLMEFGCYGRLDSVVPPITVPAWMCMATGQDPGSLGVYGFRNRTDTSYSGPVTVNSRAFREIAIWDQVAREGGQSIIIGVPPSYPPRRVNGVMVGCFLTPDTARAAYTYPVSAKDEIASIVGDYPADVRGSRGENKEWLREEVHAMSRKHFAVVRYFLESRNWDYFQFVEIGLDRLQHGFWQYHDPRHALYEPGSRYENTIRDYYVYLDEELGSILELLDDDTTILLVSDHGAQRLDGGLCVNEWLVREGLLALAEYPQEITSLDKAEVDWEKTKAWSEGGYCARVFLNVKGREPKGTISPADYEAYRNEVRAKLEAIRDDQGQPLGTIVFKPDQIYRTVRNVAPDLIVHLDGLHLRALGPVGYPTIYAQERDGGPEGCNYAQTGAFVLAGSGLHLQGEVEGAHLLDMAPTLLELGGYDVPPSMQGRSLADGQASSRGADTGLSAMEEEILRERLRGLGYIS